MIIDEELYRKIILAFRKREAKLVSALQDYEELSNKARAYIMKNDMGGAERLLAAMGGMCRGKNKQVDEIHALYSQGFEQIDIALAIVGDGE